MIICIDTEEALKFSLSVQDCAVLDVIRKLINSDKGAVFTEGSRFYKWLTDSLIFQHLQCPSFRSSRQLHNIIKKLCAVGLIIKRRYLGKPYYSVIQKKAAAVPGSSRRAAVPAAKTAQPSQPSIQSRPVAPSSSAAVFGGAAVPPTADEVTAFAQLQNWRGFDVAGFIKFNTGKNWSALRYKNWRALAADWYNQQKKKEFAPITEDRLNDLKAQGIVKQGEYYKIGQDEQGRSMYKKRTPEEYRKAITKEFQNLCRQGQPQAAAELLKICGFVQPQPSSSVSSGSAPSSPAAVLSGEIKKTAGAAYK